jgi:hypothetical protein
MNFKLGQVVITRPCQGHFERLQLQALPYLQRHATCDWGDLGASGKAANDHALKHNQRILSRYTLPDSEAIYIITEWDRSVTTILLTSDH